jgi:hypothetical protein
VDARELMEAQKLYRERVEGAEVMRESDDQGFDLGSSHGHACDADEGAEAVDACLV